MRLVHNTLGRGVLNAMKAGFAASQGDVVVVMMADRSDEPKDVSAMARLVPKGPTWWPGRGYFRWAAGRRPAVEANPVAAGGRFPALPGRPADPRRDQ